jgi:hypothetical protein
MKYGVTCSILLFIGMLSCTRDIGKPKIECVTPSIVSFNQNIIPLFNQYCNTSGCHSGTSPSGNLNLEASVAYSRLTAPGKGYIDTINPNYSLLTSQMNSISQPMPPSGNLDKCKLDLVFKWIQQKAKNN